MKEETLIKMAESLVEITIQKHKNKLLATNNMSNFIKNNLPIGIEIKDYNSILHLYNKYLAKEGYEIKKDITKFDIINYNSEEYQLYIKKL